VLLKKRDLQENYKIKAPIGLQKLLATVPFEKAFKVEDLINIDGLDCDAVPKLVWS